MRNSLFLVALCCFTARADEPKVDAVKAEQKKLEGTWLLTGVEIKGTTTPAPDDGTLFVFGADGSLVAKEKGRPDKKGTYRVDPAKTPREIDFVGAAEKGKEAGAKLMLAIYERDGNTLRLGVPVGGDPAKTRLGGFEAADACIWHLKRLKDVPKGDSPQAGDRKDAADAEPITNVVTAYFKQAASRSKVEKNAELFVTRDVSVVLIARVGQKEEVFVTKVADLIPQQQKQLGELREELAYEVSEQKVEWAGKSLAVVSVAYRNKFNEGRGVFTLTPDGKSWKIAALVLESCLRN